MPTVQEAITAYLAEREAELSDSSIQNHRYQLKRWREWCGGAGELSHIGEVKPLDLSRFRRHRSQSINSNTMYNQLSVLRLFLGFCERMGWVGSGVPDSIVLPTRNGAARDSCIDPDRVAAILDSLERYAYGSVDHVILALMWTCSMRISGVRALDIDDVYCNERWVNVVHRPGRGTPLKNKEGSEREVQLHGWVADVLRAWIDDRRPAVTDEYDREPLVASRYGRLAGSSIRMRVYKLTACGGVTDGCECDSDPITKCDEVVSPHDIRRSSISAWLDRGSEPDLLSGRVDTSVSTMEKHYDIRSERQKRELRRDAFDL